MRIGAVIAGLAQADGKLRRRLAGTENQDAATSAASSTTDFGGGCPTCAALSNPPAAVIELRSDANSPPPIPPESKHRWPKKPPTSCEEACQESRQASVLPSQGDRRRADEALQRALRDAIYAGPRGMRKKLTGPFQIWLNAPELGHLAQALGAHVRYKTSLSPRLSETAILATAQFWKAQYEWFAHAPMAEKAGVKPQTVKDIQAGREPKSAAKDELAIIDFVRELYKTRARQRQDLQARACLPGRCRRGRAGRHLRLLRDDLDDAQRVPRRDAAGDAAAVRRTGLGPGRTDEPAVQFALYARPARFHRLSGRGASRTGRPDQAKRSIRGSGCPASWSGWSATANSRW